MSWNRLRSGTCWALAALLGACAAAPSTPQEPAAAQAPPEAETVAAEAAPQGRPLLPGVDRHDWEALEVSPVLGAVAHRPVYFTERWGNTRWRVQEDRPSPLRADGEIVAQATAATAHPRHRPGPRDLADTGLGTVKFYLDVALLPFRMIGSPPFTTVHHSPRGD